MNFDLVHIKFSNCVIWPWEQLVQMANCKLTFTQVVGIGTQNRVNCCSGGMVPAKLLPSRDLHKKVYTYASTFKIIKRETC